MILSQSKCSRRLWMLIGVAIGWVVTLGQNQAILELPPFVVTEQVPGPRWRYARIDGFEILSQASNKKTREVVSALWRGRQMILPSKLMTQFSVPMIVVVFDQPPVKAGNLKAMGSVRGANDETTHWANVIKRTLGDHETFAINLWRADFEYSNAFRFDIDTLLEDRAPAAPGWLKKGLFGHYGLYREGWRWRPGDKLMRVPRAWWFSNAETEQAALCYEIAGQKARLSGLRLPDAYDPALLFFIPDLREVLEPRSVPTRALESALRAASKPGSAIHPREGSVIVEQTIDLPKIEVTSDFPDRLASAAALFVRWGIYGRTTGDAQKFWLFAERCCAEPVTEKLFQECFGMSYGEARLELAHYLPQAVSEQAAAPIGPIPLLPVFKLRDASVMEIARLRGEWERTESVALSRRFPELAQQYREKARRTFATADGILDGHDPRLLASMGLLALDAGETNRAHELLEQAAAGEVIAPRVYYELARLRWLKMSESKAQPSADFIEGVVALLLTTEGQNPHLPGVYLFLAEVALRSGECSVKHTAALRRGLEYFPKDRAICTRIAAPLKHVQVVSPNVVP